MQGKEPLETAGSGTTGAHGHTPTIVERLRGMQYFIDRREASGDATVCAEAADEIERLRNLVAFFQAAR